MATKLELSHGIADALARRVAFAGVFGILLVAFLTVIDVLLRWLLSASVPGFNEVLALTISFAIAATFPACITGRGNLSLDLVADLFGEKTLERMKIGGEVALLIFLALLAWSVFDTAQDLRNRGAATVILRVPQAPFAYAVAALLGISTAAQAIVVVLSIQQAVPPTRARDGLGGSVALALGASAILLGLLVAGFEPLARIARAIPLWTSGLLFLVMWAAVFLTVPVAASLGLVGLVGLALVLGFVPSITVLGSSAIEYLTSTQLAVLPLFLMMGTFAGVAGLSNDIYRLAHVLLGHRKGGLALATIGGCAGFGALTGSSIATAATIGQVAMPEMRTRGYDAGFATGCVAAGGTLGQLVPPSTALILYALLTEESIGALFIAAIVPAMIAVAFYLVTVAVLVRVRPSIAPSRNDPPTWRETFDALRQSWGVLTLFAIVLGGIYGGVFTATEAAAVGAGYTFLFALFRGRLSRGALWVVMRETTATTAMLYVIFFGVSIFSYFIDVAGLPDSITKALSGLPLPPVAVIAILLVVFLLMGSVMDSFAVMVITVPILAPFIQDIGYSLVWWGIVNLIVVETGMITPPFGMNVFVLKGVAGGDVPTATIFRGVAPFVCADLIKLVIIVLIPPIVLWLPATMR